jgi:valyl-tRNA synthetase
MENLRDWCISRQLWWGHRVPVWWTEEAASSSAAGSEDPVALPRSEGLESGPGDEDAGGLVRTYGNRRYVFARDRETAVRALGTENCWQDEDVLDTWFSSALWPQATLGWPRQTADLDYFYPTSLLSTAQEILYLWVARMIMTGLDFVKRPVTASAEGDGLLQPDGVTRAIIPFRDVYVHATVLDEKGERMSKTKGNGIDPMDLVEKYGADATRFSLLQQAGKNQDIRYSEQRTDIAGNFCNKLWNASRFVLMNLEAGATGELPPADRRTTADRWILARLTETTAAVNAALADYDMDDATRHLYQFFWNDYCDWYVEMAKVRLRSENPNERLVAQNMLCGVLERTLRLLHPMIPFITEEIWQALPEPVRIADQFSGSNRPLLTLAAYPQANPEWSDPEACEAMALVTEATRALRNLRAEMRIEPGVRLAAAAVGSDAAAGRTLTENADLIANLARLSGLQVLDSAPTRESGQWMATPIGGAEVFLEIGDALDVGKERERLKKELAEVEKQIARSEGMLGNAKFIERANPEVVAKEQGLLTEWREKRIRLVERQEKLV